MERIPLLKDSHNHLYIYSSLMDALDISGAKTKEEAIKLLSEYCKTRDVSVAVGWSTRKFDLRPSDLSGLPPVVVCNSTLHGFIASPEAEYLVNEYNCKMLEKLGDQFWVEKHLPEVMGFVSSITGFREERVRRMNQYLLSLGIYKQEDMYVPDERYIEYIKNSDLNSRVEIWTGIENYKNMGIETKEKVKGIKIFADGALGTETASLERGFKSGSKGVLIWSDEELGELMERAGDVKNCVSVHAIGDGAIEQILRVYEQVEAGVNISLRVEHCLMIRPEEAEKAKDLGIVLCMQPNFSRDTVNYRDRLEKDYLNSINPFRMLIEDVGFVPGKDLILGSDGMPQGAEAALKYSLLPPLKSQTLTIEEFVAAYCIDTMDPGFIDVDISGKSGDLSCDIVLI